MIIIHTSTIFSLFSVSPFVVPVNYFSPCYFLHVMLNFEWFKFEFMKRNLLFNFANLVHRFVLDVTQNLRAFCN
jgi:hypothetical protein